MDRIQGPPDPSTDEFEGSARRGSSKLPWILAGWIALSALAVVGALVLNRNPGSPASTSPTTSGIGPGGLPQDAGVNGAQGDARLPAAASSPPQEPADGSRNWTLHLIYTAVEKYYGGVRIRVSGCPASVCTAKRVSLGTFPATFVDAVKASGSGVISTGRHANKYLDWDASVGFWLDSAARGYGAPAMKSFASARSTSPLLPLGTPLRISVCGPSAHRNAIGICTRLRTARWNVVTTGQPSAARDIWLYAGRETGPGAAGRPWANNFRHATLRIG